MNFLPTLLRLCGEFFLTGLFAVGGGLATLPFLYEIGEKTGWFTENDVLDMIAVSESTPGPIGVNMATYTGFTVGSASGGAAGVLGSVLATLSLILPSLIIGIVISGFLAKFKDSPLVNGTFSFLRPASTALITAAGLGVAYKVFFPNGFEGLSSFASFFTLFDYKALILAAAVAVTVIFWKKAHPIWLILASAAAGIIFSM
ncbi:MAG: chromate transporter [Clostridia bacterium]|nr:chromate transporter [Clostridia bacterium]